MLTRWNPLAEMVSMREAINRLINDAFVRPGALLGTGAGFVAFPVDVYESGDQVVVRAAIPGADPNQIGLSVNQGVLTISGAYATGVEQEQQYTWHVRGLPHGTFQFAVALPTAVNADAAEASCEHGILTVMLPKAETAKAKPIAIKGVQAKQEQLPSGAQ